MKGHSAQIPAFIAFGLLSLTETACSPQANSTPDASGGAVYDDDSKKKPQSSIPLEPTMPVYISPF